MDIRIVGIATAAAAVLVAGCGGNNGSAATPTSSVAKASSSAAPTPVASNEDQIRDVLNKEGAALSAWDFDTVAELTCAKFRDQARSADNAVPPMTMFSADRAASMGAQSFASLLGEQFGGASDQSLQAVADAVIRR